MRSTYSMWRMDGKSIERMYEMFGIFSKNERMKNREPEGVKFSILSSSGNMKRIMKWVTMKVLHMIIVEASGARRQLSLRCEDSWSIWKTDNRRMRWSEHANTDVDGNSLAMAILKGRYVSE